MSVYEVPSGGWRASALRWRRRLRRLGRRQAKVIRWVTLCLALAGIGVFLAFLTSGRVADEPAFVDAREAARRKAIEARSGAGAASEGSQVEPRTGAESTESKDAASTAASKTNLITRGVTVQVLNGTRVGKADDRMVDRLLDLGYHVLAVHRSAKRYRETTVYWSRRNGRKAAEALARRFGWVSARKPNNLSASVTTHVVVGRDEA